MLGDNILKLRKKIGLSQEELSEKINVTRQTISNWELNETQPNPEQLKLLSKTFNVSVDELIGNDIKSVIEEKINTNTKTTRLLIYFIIGFGVSIFLVFIFDAFYQITHRNYEVNSTELSCTLNDVNYIVSMKDNNYFKCINCSEELKNELETNYFEYSDLDKSTRNIKFYFEEHDGYCEE